jgi:DNA polymerase III delta prime subunit
MAVNPFNWTGPVTDGVPRADFARSVALTLKGGVHVAMFGPRGTGKTTFIGEVARQLLAEQEPDAPRWETVAVDLRRVISIPAFIGAVSDAVDQHPSRRLRRNATAAFKRLEKEIGVNLGVIKAGIKAGGSRHVNEEVVLHDQLAAIARVADRVVVAFDEFQRLNNCPGEPLSIIRSALMGSDSSGRVSLLLTGSLRERLKLMLHTDTEPIWDQTHDEDLPDLDFAAFAEYLELKFAATGKPIGERAVEHLLRLTNGHPKRTQHVAWYVWDRAGSPTITEADVQSAFDHLVTSGKDNTDFAKVLDTLISGDDAEVNDAKALFLLTSGGSVGSELDARRYGLTDEKATRRALERLRGRGIVQTGEAGRWLIVDPLLEAWLHTQDPLRVESRRVDAPEPASD